MMGCESFVLYKHLNTMGGVCFIAAADTLDAKRQLLATYFKIRQQGGIATAAMDARVQLNPINPDMVWAKGLFGGGRWGRRRQPKPAPGPAPVPPPAPLPPQTGPAPTPPEPGPNGGGNPATTPDPNVYNWGLDRANQQNRPMDKNNLQCPSRGAGVVVFVLDTGCRTSHQVGGSV